MKSRNENPLPSNIQTKLFTHVSKDLQASDRFSFIFHRTCPCLSGHLLYMKPVGMSAAAFLRSLSPRFRHNMRRIALVQRPLCSQHICGFACQACMLNSSECLHVSSFQSITWSMCTSWAPVLTSHHCPSKPGARVFVSAMCVCVRVCTSLDTKAILCAQYTGLDLRSWIWRFSGKMCMSGERNTSHNISFILNVGLMIQIFWMKHLKKGKMPRQKAHQREADMPLRWNLWADPEEFYGNYHWWHNY